MRRKMLMASFALAVVLPVAAHAQETCEQRSQNRTAGTVVGGLLGALVGSSVAGHGHKGDGAVVGAVAGAVVGNQVAKGPKDCQHAYGWYDNANRWHANNVDPNSAWGYYDRRGVWIEGRPADYRPVEYRAPDRDRGPPDRQDWDHAEFLDGPGYAEFRDLEAHIRGDIHDGFREGSIRRDDAQDLMGRLRDIRADEVRYYHDDGDRLRHDDRMRLRMRLRDLDRRVDRIRHSR
jgi:hypothetical protein